MSRAGPGRLSTDQSNEPAAAIDATEQFTLPAGTVLFLIAHPSIPGAFIASGDHASFFWDDSNNRLGIGTNSPAEKLHVADEDTRTSSVDVIQRLQSTTTGTPAAGIGVGLEFDAESADETPSPFGRLDFLATDVTAASEDTVLDVLARIAGAALAAIYRFAATGAFRAIFTHANTADRTYTLPDESGTILTTLSAITKVFNRDLSVTTVSNTTTETIVSTFTIPALTNVSDGYRIRLYGFYLNNSGGNSDFTIRVKIGAITAATSTFTVATNASQRAIGFDCFFSGAGSANADLEYKGYVGAPGTDAGTTTQTSPTVLYATNSAFAVDWTASQVLEITFQHSVANANISATQRATFIEELE